MEQRLQPRIEVDGPIRVQLFGSPQSSFDGKLANFSESGLMVNLPEPIDLGEAVQMDGGDDLIVAEVRHCEPSTDGFLIGFEICDWTSKGRLREVVASFHGFVAPSPI